MIRNIQGILAQKSPPKKGPLHRIPDRRVVLGLAEAFQDPTSTLVLCVPLCILEYELVSSIR